MKQAADNKEIPGAKSQIHSKPQVQNSKKFGY
jgi:hypothetical protein